MKRILLTGAGGGIGTHLRRELRGVYALRLSDREPITNLAGDDFMTAELTNFDAVAALMDTRARDPEARSLWSEPCRCAVP